jgi:hypothetical protein
MALEQDARNAGNSFNTTDRPELPLSDHFPIAQGEEARYPLSQPLIEDVEDQTWDTRACAELYKEIMER